MASRMSRASGSPITNSNGEEIPRTTAPMSSTSAVAPANNSERSSIQAGASGMLRNKVAVAVTGPPTISAPIQRPSRTTNNRPISEKEGQRTDKRAQKMYRFFHHLLPGSNGPGVCSHSSSRFRALARISGIFGRTDDFRLAGASKQRTHCMEFENDRSQKLQARHLLLGRSRDYESHCRETLLQRAVRLEDTRQSAPRRRRLYACSNQRGRHRWSDGDDRERDSVALEFVRGGRER